MLFLKASELAKLRILRQDYGAAGLDHSIRAQLGEAAGGQPGRFRKA